MKRDGLWMYVEQSAKQKYYSVERIQTHIQKINTNQAATRHMIDMI